MGIVYALAILIFGCIAFIFIATQIDITGTGSSSGPCSNVAPEDQTSAERL